MGRPVGSLFVISWYSPAYAADAPAHPGLPTRKSISQGGAGGAGGTGGTGGQGSYDYTSYGSYTADQYSSSIPYYFVTYYPWYNRWGWWWAGDGTNRMAWTTSSSSTLDYGSYQYERRAIVQNATPNSIPAHYKIRRRSVGTSTAYTSGGAGGSGGSGGGGGVGQGYNQSAGSGSSGSSGSSGAAGEDSNAGNGGTGGTMCQTAGWDV